MAWLEYEDEAGAGWRVTVLDGTPDKAKVAHAVRTRHPQTDDDGPSAHNVAEVVSNARFEFHQELPPEHDTLPYCDIFVLRPPDESHHTPELAHRPPLLGDRAPEDAIYIVQIEKGCPYSSQCLQGVVGALGAQLRHESDYDDFAAYRNHVRRLAGQLLTPYIRPCAVALGILERRGFQCSSE